MRVRLALIVLVLVLPAFSACGGDDEPETLPVAEATERIDALCARAARQVDAVDPGLEGDFEAGRARLARLLTINVELQRQLDELSIDGAALRRYVSVHRDQVRAQRAAMAKVRSDEVAQVEAGATELQEVENLPARAATAAGLEKCGGATVDSGTEPSKDGDVLVPGSGLVGTWKGEVVQHGPDDKSSRYPVEMEIAAEPDLDGNNGSVRYESFPCVGRVRIVASGPTDDGSGYRYRMRERILDNRDKCSNNATIDAVTEGDELDWRWRKGGVSGVATLRRVGAAEQPAVEKEAAINGGNLVGRWTGTATQYGPGDYRNDFEVVMGIYRWEPAPGSQDGWVTYPASPCTAVLNFDHANGGLVSFAEHVIEGDCIDRGTLDVRRLAADSLAWRWRGKASDKSPVDVLATLNRESADPAPPPGASDDQRP